MTLEPTAAADRLALSPLATAATDYDVVRRAIAHIRGNWRSQPEINAIARAAGISATDLHHLFRRWCGLTPKAFLQALTLHHARELLRSSASVLDTAYEVGLSGPGRLHDLFITHESMSPGEWKAGGEGLTMTYGFHPCPFGMALVMTTPRGLAGLALADAGKERAALRDMKARWPKAKYVEDFAVTAPTARRIFDAALWRKDQPLRVVLIGTDFDLAAKAGAPKAARAVGAAVGKNPICFVVPCHRVIGKSGELTGYHWGLTRKRAMLGWEAGMVAA
ncbi:MAG: bifunctional helix-turn-helix domain-containing protein/methylated-DNA--[protein]-cysteine S-methyltransferase [Pseudolabrys sp.]